MIAGAPDDKGEGLAMAVRDRISHQVTGEQDRDIGIDRDLPGSDDRSDMTAGFGRRDWFSAQPDVTAVQFGRTGRCHHVYSVSQLTCSAPPCVENVAAICSARHRSADGY
jgi:hypothetical protein